VVEENNACLMEEISLDELNEAMLSLQKDKSLRPEGWSVEFYSSSMI